MTARTAAVRTTIGIVVGALVFTLPATTAGATTPAEPRSPGRAATVTMTPMATDVVYSPSNAGVATADTLEEALFDLQDNICPRKVALPAPPARAKAQAQAWAALTAITGKGRSAVRSLALARKTKGAAALAKIPNTVVAGIASGSTRAALAASLRGAELEPANQRHLVNAAVLLMGYGRHREANGLLAAAAKLRSPAGAPFGISPVAALRAAQGELALATGQFARAETLYRSAAKLSPLLAEARLGVAHALACGKKMTAAVRWKVRGERRKDVVKPGDAVNPEPAVMVEDLGDAGTISGVDLASFGTLKRPSNAAEGAAAREEFKAAYDAVDTPFYALLAQRDAITLNYGSRSLSRWIGYVSERVAADATIKRFEAEGDDLQGEWLDRTGLIESRPACYYTDQHDALFDLHRRRLAWADGYARYYHRLLTSLAAQVADPDYSRTLNLDADMFANRLYSGVMQLAYYTVDTEKSEGADRPPEPDYPSPCYRGAPVGAGDGQNKPEDSSPATNPCSAAKAVRTKIKLGSSVSAEFSCEGGKVEVVPVKWGIDPAYVGMFGEAGVKWKNGDVTAVAGVKAAVSTDGIPGLPPAGVSGKVGAYITAGKGKGLPEFGGGSRSTYTVKDYGIRVQATAEIPLGKAGAFTTITKFDDKTDISLVGVFFPEK